MKTSVDGQARRNRLVTAAGLALVLCGAGGFVAYAGVPDTAGAISGCYDARTGALRVIDVEGGQKCGAKEKPISWNVEGPAGTPGVEANIFDPTNSVASGVPVVTSGDAVSAMKMGEGE